MSNTTARLNLGCGGRPLKDYINLDMDILEEMRKRCPNQKFDDDLTIEQYDLFDLPYKDISIDKFQWKGDRDHMLRLTAQNK